MKTLLAMMRKEFIHIGRDPQLVGFVFALPIILLFLFGYALRLKVDNLVAAVWDQDRTFFSLAVKDRLQSEGGFSIVEVDSEETIREDLLTGRARLGLVIPKGFSKALADREQTTFSLFVDGTMPTLALAAVYGMNSLTNEDAAEELTLDDPEHPAPPVRKPPIKFDQVILFNPDLRDALFFLPGTIGMVITILTLTLSQGLVREKEQQTIEQLLVTPISRFELIAGKMIPYGVVAWLDFLAVAILSWLVFGLPFHGSLVAVGVVAALFILALLALGALISTVTQTQIQANLLSVFFIVPSVLMSGVVFPVEAMPRWIRMVAWSLPMTYFVDALRALTLKGASTRSLAPDFAALGLFLVTVFGLSLARFRKQAL